MSDGVFTRSNVSVFGSQRTVLNEPASKLLRSLPEPAMIRTLPVRSSAAWMAFTRMSSGTSRVDHCPCSAL